MIADLYATARRDPAGALAALCVAVAAGLAAAMAMQEFQPFQAVPTPEHKPGKPIPHGPAKWIRAAKPGDILTVPGHRLSYWGDPRAPYGPRVTRTRRKFAGIVVHFPVSGRLMPSVLYGHTRDKSRGGGSFGYHFYVGQRGEIVQGAPLSRRTNHVRDVGSSKRRPGIASGHDSRDLIGVTTIGACHRGTGPMCETEVISPEQREATLAVIRALQAKYNLPCDAIWGHGEMQTNRLPFEGRTIATEVRARCRDIPMAVGR